MRATRSRVCREKPILHFSVFWKRVSSWTLIISSNQVAKDIIWELKRTILSSSSRCHSLILKLHMFTCQENRNSCNAKLHVTQCLDYIGESCMVFFARCLTLYCKNYIISQSQRRVFVLRRYILCANSNYTSEICISRKSREEIRNLELRASLRTVDPGNEVAWKRGQRLHRLRKFFCPPFWIYLEKDYRRYELFFSKEAIFLTTLWVNKVNLMFSQWRNPGWVEFYGGVCVFRWRGVWRDRWQIIPLRSSLV